MKVVSSLKRICPDCYFVKRGKKLYLRCTTSPRHKRRQGFSTLTRLYTGIAEGDGITPMNGLGSIPVDAQEIIEEVEENSNHS